MTDVPEQSAPHDPTSDLPLAAERFIPGGAISPVSGSPRLVRVETEGHVAVVRQWPAETTREHVDFVHALHAALLAANLALIAPMLPLAGEQATVLALNGRLYDARAWLPGEPLGQPSVNDADPEPVDFPSVISEAALVATVEAIARFHQVSTSLARHDQRLTIRQLRQAARQLWQVYRDRLRPAAPSNPPIQHWLRTGERVLPMALALIDREPDLAQATSVVGHHRLWPAHVLRQRHISSVPLSSCHSEPQRGCPPGAISRFPEPRTREISPSGRNDMEGDDREGAVAISGLVGLSDPAWGTPLLDLAQIATRFARWSPALAEELIGSYSAVRRISPAERRLLPAVAVLDLIVQIGRLLDLAYGPAGPAAPPAASSPLVVAAESLIANLEAVSESLSALTPPNRAASMRRRRGPAPAARPVKRRSGNSRQRRDHLT